MLGWRDNKKSEGEEQEDEKKAGDTQPKIIYFIVLIKNRYLLFFVPRPRARECEK